MQQAILLCVSTFNPNQTYISGIAEGVVYIDSSITYSSVLQAMIMFYI